MKKIFTILIGFIHDFAAGCWAATVLAVYWIDKKGKEYAELKGILKTINKEFFYIGLICIAVVFLAGAGRTFTYAYTGNVYGEEAEKLRRKMLIIKHIILFVLFGVGTYWQYQMAFR